MTAAAAVRLAYTEQKLIYQQLIRPCRVELNSPELGTELAVSCAAKVVCAWLLILLIRIILVCWCFRFGKRPQSVTGSVRAQQSSKKADGVQYFCFFCLSVFFRRGFFSVKRLLELVREKIRHHLIRGSMIRVTPYHARRRCSTAWMCGSNMQASKQAGRQTEGQEVSNDVHIEWALLWSTDESLAEDIFAVFRVLRVCGMLPRLPPHPPHHRRTVRPMIFCVPFSTLFFTRHPSKECPHPPSLGSRRWAPRMAWSGRSRSIKTSWYTTSRTDSTWIYSTSSTTPPRSLIGERRILHAKTRRSLDFWLDWIRKRHPPVSIRQKTKMQKATHTHNTAVIDSLPRSWAGGVQYSSTNTLGIYCNYFGWDTCLLCGCLSFLRGN